MQEFDHAKLKPDVNGGVDVAVFFEQRAHRGMRRLMAIANQAAQFVKIGESFERRVEIVFNQRCVGSLEVFRGSEIAEQMNGRGTERIVAGLDTRAGIVNGDAELFVSGAMPFEFAPVAGSERKAVAVENGTAGNGAG